MSENDTQPSQAHPAQSRILVETIPAPTTPAAEATPPAPKPARLDPTRYGDWELNGKCVDF